MATESYTSDPRYKVSKTSDKKHTVTFNKKLVFSHDSGEEAHTSAQKHKDSQNLTIPLGGDDRIEYTKIPHIQKKKNTMKDSMKQTSFAFEDFTPEEMNTFLNEKYKSLDTHPDDEKDEEEDVKLIKKMVKKPALKSDVDEALDLSGLKKGALHKDLDVPEDEKIPAKKLKVTSDDSTLEVKRKTFAKNAKNWKHESVMESFNVNELSFISATPITSSLAEAIAMVMEAK